MPELTVSVAYARCLLDVAVTSGGGREEILAAAGILAQDLTDKDARLPMNKYVELMRAAKDSTGNPALGLHYGASVDMQHISVVGLLFHASESIIAGLEQVNRYAHLLCDVDSVGERFQFKRLGGKLWVFDSRRAPVDFPELTETALARFTAMTSSWTTNQLIREVNLSYPAPQYWQEYDRIFRARVKFNTGWNALQLDEAVFERRSSPQPDYVFGILSAHADELHRNFEKSKSVRGHVERLLMPILHEGSVSAQQIAGKMSMSRQTLYRLLRREGVTFEQVLDELRRDLSLHYVSGQRASLNEIAYLVGFADAASFSRAFRRWTGRTARSMRERCCGPAVSRSSSSALDE
jgi:AraC-like DNA-binding protein